MTLSTSSPLYAKLCSAIDGTCSYPNIVVLDSNLECDAKECEVDTLRVVQVGSVYYEYIPVPCVEQAFFHNAKKIVNKDYTEISCANPKREVASPACCECESSAIRKESYWGERVSFETAQSRCEAMEYNSCGFPAVKDCKFQWWIWQRDCDHNPYYWSSSACTIKIKVNPEDGKISLFYDTDD